MCKSVAAQLCQDCIKTLFHFFRSSKTKGKRTYFVRGRQLPPTLYIDSMLRIKCKLFILSSKPKMGKWKKTRERDNQTSTDTTNLQCALLFHLTGYLLHSDMPGRKDSQRVFQ